MSLWTKTSGTWINVATVLSGTALGLVLQRQLMPSLHQIITQGIGLVTLVVGMTMALELAKVTISHIDGVVLALVCLVLGGALGELVKLDDRLYTLGNWLQQHMGKGNHHFTEGFMTASLLFCVGPLTLIGSLNNGLTGDNRLLVLKAMMDGISAMTLTSSFGIGVGYSTVVILLYQGGISLAAGSLAQVLPNPETAPSIMLITGIGGVIILGLGLNLLKVAQIRVASFLPAFLLAPLLCWLLGFIG